MARRLASALTTGPTTSGGTTIYGYLTLTTSSSVNATSFPQISITLPSGDPTTGLAFYLAYFDPVNAPGGSQMGMLGSETTTGNTVTFPPQTQPFTLAPNQLYIFVLYSIGAATPSPSPTANPTTVPTTSPAPSASPTTAPSGSGPVFTPSLLSAITINSEYGPQTWSVTLADGNYTGPWHPVSGNSSVITVTDCSNCTSLIVNPIAAGKTTITVTDGAGHVGTLPVYVTEVDVVGDFSTAYPTSNQWQINPSSGALVALLPVPKPLPSSNTFKSILWFFGVPPNTISAEVLDPTYAPLYTEMETPGITLGTVNTVTFNL